MLKRNKVIIAVVSVLIINTILIVMMISGIIGKRKDCYINSAKVYNEFLLKKDLEKKLLQVVEIRKQELDSMGVELKMLDKKINGGGATTDDKRRFDFIVQMYREKNSKYQEEEQQLTSTYDTQIWTQLNQYIKEYGEKKGYDYVFGADGTGNIMYGNSKKDVTSEVVTFVNDRYEGGK